MARSVLPALKERLEAVRGFSLRRKDTVSSDDAPLPQPWLTRMVDSAQSAFDTVAERVEGVVAHVPEGLQALDRTCQRYLENGLDALFGNTRQGLMSDVSEETADPDLDNQRLIATPASEIPKNTREVPSPLAPTDVAISGSEGVMVGEGRIGEHNTFPDDHDAETLNRRLLLSGVAVGATGIGLAVSPLVGVLTTPLFFYIQWPIFKAAARDLVKDKTVKVDGLMALFNTTAWATGAFFAGSLSCFTYAFADVITWRTRERSQTRLVTMFDQQPRAVRLLLDDREVETPYHLVQEGDLVVVHAGEVIPVDGTVNSGLGLVEQQRLTGEARPVDKETGDPVFAATLLVRGRVVVRVDRAGQATLAAQIGHILNQTTSHHLEIEERGLELADKSVLPSLALSALALPLQGFRSAVAVLSAMPGVDMYYAGPLALLNFLHLTARQGILVKDGRSLELLHTVDTIVFDKTGTLTLEQPSVHEVHTLDVHSSDAVLILAATAERHQSHPIALAIQTAAEARHLSMPAAEDGEYQVGLGVQVKIRRSKLARAGVQVDALESPEADPTITIRVGSERFIRRQGQALPEQLEPIQKRCSDSGHSLIYVEVNGVLAGALELHATIRPEVRAVVQELHQQGLKLYILSGDQVEPTRHLAEALGIEHYAANVLPTAKAQFITDLQEEGRKVCFVGDGINDAIALKQATVSISLRGATTVAVDTAQIILMEQGLRQLPELFTMAHKLERNLLQSLGLSIGTGAVIVAGALVFHAGVGAAVIFGSLAELGIVGNAMLPLLSTLKEEEPKQAVA